MKHYLLWFLLILLTSSVGSGQEIITFGTLIDEMTDLNRLTFAPAPAYRAIQFSSYDRRSQRPQLKGWFSNADGFGGEPIPGFEEVLAQPDQEGIGTYLICDVRGAGAILRRWTAGINGAIRCYLDDMEDPFFEGKAIDFFWNEPDLLTGMEMDTSRMAIFRHSDANYIPLPFSSRCRIEWTGDIRKIHFYHIGFRLYQPGTLVKTFSRKDPEKYKDKLQQLIKIFRNPDQLVDPEDNGSDSRADIIPAHSRVELLKKEGSAAIDQISFKLDGEDITASLRQCVLNIYFDDSEVPQVQAPLGDFFGAAPGLNPYVSLPFSVKTDSVLACRFPMPFHHNVRIVIENFQDQSQSLSSRVHFTEYNWKEGTSMHFHARWRMDRGLTASNISPLDIPYTLIRGKGRLVGIAAFLYNPSNAVTSWGNWWGEGDEKIFIDQDTFPSFFGTGSEDYFNYSWSSDRIFFYPYSGQPRNDGPGNRGYVSNFRWHILDDLYFQEQVAFYMELLHHGIVPDFSYGRIVYSYSLPGSMDHFMPVKPVDINMVPGHYWSPEAYLGSAGFQFIEAEKIVNLNARTTVENGSAWSEQHLLVWEPESLNDRLTFAIERMEEGNYILGLTLAHQPRGGAVSIYLNGSVVPVNGQETIDLQEAQRFLLRNYLSKELYFKEGSNEVALEFKGQEAGKVIGIDFFWLKKK